LSRIRFEDFQKLLTIEETKMGCLRKIVLENQGTVFNAGCEMQKNSSSHITEVIPKKHRDFIFGKIKKF